MLNQGYSKKYSPILLLELMEANCHAESNICSYLAVKGNVKVERPVEEYFSNGTMMEHSEALVEIKPSQDSLRGKDDGSNRIRKDSQSPKMEKIGTNKFERYCFSTRGFL